MREKAFQLIRFLFLNYFFQRTRKNQLLILMFHQVNDSNRTFYPAMPISVFKKICEYINSYYEVIHVSEIQNHFINSSRPAAIITFDDGHFDILENALPILSNLNMKFTINIDTEIIQTRKPQDFVRVWDILNQVEIDNYFNPSFMSKPIKIDRDNPMNTEREFTKILANLDSLQRRKFVDEMETLTKTGEIKFSTMLSAEDIKFLHKNSGEVASHSHTHSILTNLATDEVDFELSESKRILEEITCEEVNTLAYPNGVFSEEVMERGKKLGYKFFLKTEEKINRINREDLETSFFRVNQYHKSASEALAHIYGITNFLRKII